MGFPAARSRRAVLRVSSCALVASFVLSESTLPPANAAASMVTPVELTMVGPEAVSVRVARGTTLPCDSGDNRMLVQGKFNAGQVVRTSSSESCVCIQQTYQPFPDVDWAPGGVVCRPQLCTGAGKARRCVPAKDPTIRLRIQSQRPQ